MNNQVYKEKLSYMGLYILKLYIILSLFMLLNIFFSIKVIKQSKKTEIRSRRIVLAKIISKIQKNELTP
jgi:hypothetical protein